MGNGSYTSSRSVSSYSLSLLRFFCLFNVLLWRLCGILPYRSTAGHRRSSPTTQYLWVVCSISIIPISAQQWLNITSLLGVLRFESGYISDYDVLESANGPKKETWNLLCNGFRRVVSRLQHVSSDSPRNQRKYGQCLRLCYYQDNQA